jgi:hypothetical protein
MLYQASFQGHLLNFLWHFKDPQDGCPSGSCVCVGGSLVCEEGTFFIARRYMEQKQLFFLTTACFPQNLQKLTSLNHSDIGDNFKESMNVLKKTI